MIRYNPNINIGLTDKQVEERYKDNLVNFDTEVPTKSVKQIITNNIFTIFNFLNLVLAIAIVIAHSYRNLMFMGVVICNIFISTIQELRAKRIIDKLSVVSSSKVSVLRNGKIKELSINEIVLDDLIKLKLGNQVITDSVILDGECEVDESFITGEVNTVFKKKGDMLLSGSFIMSGSVTARVEHIGLDNYTAKISKEAKYIKKINSEIMSSLNKNIDSFTVVRSLKEFMPEDMATAQYGILGGKVDTLTSLPLSINVAFSTALVPAIAAAKAKKDNKTIKQKTTFSLLISMLIGLPCTVGMFIFAQPILNLLFPNANAGAQILQISSLTIIFTILDQTINGALQGYGKLMIPTVSLGCRSYCKTYFKFSFSSNTSNRSKWCSMGICCMSLSCIYNSNNIFKKNNKA